MLIMSVLWSEESRMTTAVIVASALTDVAVQRLITTRSKGWRIRQQLAEQSAQAEIIHATERRQPYPANLVDHHQ